MPTKGIETSNIISPNTIAQLVLKTYTSLPKNLKPTIRSNGVPEWTILAGIVLSSPGQNQDSILRVISLGSGVKCLPTNRLPPCGDTLHDSHAEILAKRGFRRFLVDEAISVVKGATSEVVETGAQSDNRGEFKLKHGVGVHMYISALPCGNASTLYTAAHQPKAMATLKSSNLPSSPESNSMISRGRNGYSDTTSLRTKPGRPDSFPSISMSCSDKISSWSVLGLQGALLSRCFEPIYLDSITIGGVGRPPPTDGEVVGWDGDEREWKEAIKAEVEESIFGRLDRVKSNLPHPYRLARPRIQFTDLPFQFDKPSVSSLHPASNPVPQPTSVLHYRTTSSVTESNTEHHFQGCDRRVLWKAPGLVPIAEKRRSGVCKLEMMRAVCALEEVLKLDRQDAGDIECENKGAMTYHQYKQQSETYQSVKALLRGRPGEKRLIPGFEKCGPLAFTEADPVVNIIPAGEGSGQVSAPPFLGWIVSGRDWENFDSEGKISTPRKG